MLKISRILGNVKGLAQKQRLHGSQVMSPYVSSLFEHWKKDQGNVGQGWNEYFSKAKIDDKSEHCLTLTNPQVEKKIEILFKSFNMFRQFFFSGHILANIDPLQLEDTQEFGKRKKYDVRFDLVSFNFLDSELDVPLYYGDKEKRAYIFPFMMEQEEWTIREIHSRLIHMYSQDFGVEYVHLVSEEEKHWIETQIQQLSKCDYSKTTQSKTLHRLTRAHVFNEYLKTKFPTSKRFGLEGNDTLISGLNALVDQCGEDQISNLVFGMAHRGRLSTLANVFNKPLEMIFAEFQNKYESEENAWGNSGDVKYHLGTTRLKEFQNGHVVKLTMLPNPSHLETVNPLVTGKTRAIQDLNLENNIPFKSAMSVIIHGDAAFAGQGVVYEQMQMQNLEGYRVGGTIHVVTNNQIGFTTTPVKARSGLYCTEVAKSIDAPIIHVNGDNPDLVDAIMRMAVQYRNQFQKDIVIDLIGYRRYGHNEQDQPSFTQPLMYKRIAAVKPVYQKYVEYLTQHNHLSKELIERELNESMARIDKAYQDSRREVFDVKQWTSKPDDRMIEIQENKYGRVKDTGLSLETLKSIGRKITALPKDLDVHPTIKKIYEQRALSIEEGKNIDIATAEALAFGSLLQEGFAVRLSGQDVERGTFSHRHSVLNDQHKDVKYYPLRSLIPEKEKHRFQVYNSHLSEYGVLGFEYGYSLSDPNSLTLWEAQFGDFANGAQIIIDNYLSSGESKWGVQPGLVMMLPHGMDGQGPEHSSARMERFLQLMDDDPNIDHKSTKQIRSQILNSNMQIVVCSNAANYFHVLRRQLRREFRKPLILFNSKRLLKSNKSYSTMDQFKEGDRFHRIYPDTHVGIKPALEIKRVVLCYGQMYYDIIAKREALARTDVAVIRLEQIAPFPYDHFKSEAVKYKNAEFVVCQEEHQNAGAWQYLEPRVHAVLHGLKHEGILKHSQVHFVGRKPSSSPAAGSAKVHNIELEKLLQKLFD